MCVSNKTKKTRYIFNTSCKADKESPRIAHVPPFSLTCMGCGS